MENVLFEFYIGDTYTRDFTISGYSSEIDEIFFTAKKDENDKRYVMQKKLNNGITLVDTEEDTKTYNILIDASDTDDLKADTNYYFDIKIITPVTSGEQIEKTIITGTMRLKNHATRQYNE